MPPMDTTDLPISISSVNRSKQQAFRKPQIIVRGASPTKTKKGLESERTTLNGNAFKEEDEKSSDQEGQEDPRYVPHQNGDITTGCDDEIFTVLTTPVDEMEHAGEICVASQDVLVTSESGTRVIQTGLNVDENLEELIQKTHQNANSNLSNQVCDNDNEDDEKEVKGQNGGLKITNCQPSVENEGYVSPRADMEAGNVIPPKVSLLGKISLSYINIHLVGLTSHYITQRGKIAENTVYACALLSAHTDTHGTKGKKGTISRMSDQANTT